MHSVWQALDGDTANPWRHDTFNGHSHGKKYGVVCDLYRRVVSPPVHAMPPWLQAVMQRMRDTRPPLGLMQHKVGQPQPLADETRVANRNVWDYGWEIAHAPVSRRPPISLYTIVARTHMYTSAAKVWDLSIVQGHFLSPGLTVTIATFSPVVLSRRRAAPRSTQRFCSHARCPEHPPERGPSEVVGWRHSPALLGSRIPSNRPPSAWCKAWPLRHFAPNECNAIDYRRATGCALDPHCDDRRMSGCGPAPLCCSLHHGQPGQAHSHGRPCPDGSCGGDAQRRKSCES